MTSVFPLASIQRRCSSSEIRFLPTGIAIVYSQESFRGRMWRQTDHAIFVDYLFRFISRLKLHPFNTSPDGFFGLQMVLAFDLDVVEYVPDGLWEPSRGGPYLGHDFHRESHFLDPSGAINPPFARFLNVLKIVTKPRDYERRKRKW
jgi:hypothetical protein